MKRFTKWLPLLVAAGLVWLLSLAVLASPPNQQQSLDGEVTTAAIVVSQISYQGRLTDTGGTPVDGTRSICFSLWNALAGGQQLSSECRNVLVEDGLFTLALNVTQSQFDGQGLWLKVAVEGQDLAPRQELLPVPYALSLRPGAVISGSTSSAIIHAENTHSSGRGLRGYATATSGENFGVVGASTSSRGYGGYFYNNAISGTALYARGGDDNGADLVLGGASTGDDGRIESDPAYPGSDILLYSNDEVWIDLDDDNNESGNFKIRNGTNTQVFNVDESGNMVASGSKAGYVVDIARNVGSEPLQPGDVVVIAGVSEPVIGQIPVIEVRKATTSYATGVAGVVDQAYVPERSGAQAAGSDDDYADSGFVALSSDEGVAPGGYLSLVTLGAFRWVKADATYGAIQPGDLLVTSPTAGYAMVASDPKIGTLLGKALGSLGTGQGLIPLLVTLQ